MRRHVREVGDGNIDRAVVELLDGFVAARRQKAQRRAGRLASKGPGELPDQRDLGVFGHPGGEDRGAFRRVEPGAEVERCLDRIEELIAAADDV